MAWLRRVVGLLDRMYALKFELKFPAEYRGTFIEKWGKDVSSLKLAYSAVNSVHRT
jgi:hypothetical protein